MRGARGDRVDGRFRDIPECRAYIEGRVELTRFAYLVS
jgi:hypothetical protein